MTLNALCKPLVVCLLFGTALILNERAEGQQRSIPEVLRPWEDWVTWSDTQRDCPTTYNSANDRICFWPSQLALAADQQSGSWDITVTVFAETWVPLPGSSEVWPLNVRANGAAVVVVERAGGPAVQLPTGRHELAGEFKWERMPQSIAIPQQVGLLSLTVDNETVEVPSWDASGHVWLQRIQTKEAEKDFVAAKVYRLIEDGIPIWLRTEVELTVSGKSREEVLGWVLPAGWKLATIESPLPVAVDDRARMKAQVRAGKWTISLHAFRTADVREIQFAQDAKPITSRELLGFKARPEFRLAEIEGLQSVDVTQTTFPTKWGQLPVYQWETSSAFKLIEKIRGMGLQRPEGLSINRQFWLDEDGKSLTYRDTVNGQMQQIWRLDVAAGQELGAVRVDGKGQLITANPKTGAHGVEIRTRNLNMEAIGRIDRTKQLSATGWQTDVDSLGWTIALPPGWRLFALFGADRVEGDWLTAWSLLDLFLLLIFSIAVVRMWGFQAGVVAFLAFGLAYHEPGSPRLAWIFLLMPMALLRVVLEGTGRRWIMAWGYFAVALLIITLVPFVASQIQSTLYPQLEIPGVNYASRGMFWWLDAIYERSARIGAMPSVTRALEQQAVIAERAAQVEIPNLLYDPKARIQTGPGPPEWNWNQVFCQSDGPVSAEQQIKPVLISQTQHKLLSIARLTFLLALFAIFFDVKLRTPFSKRRTAAAAVVLLMCVFPSQLPAAEIPDESMLNTLRERLLEPADAYPHAGEIPSVELKLDGNRVQLDAEIHTALEVAVPLPGRLSVWTPVSVTIDEKPAELVCRREEYLWIVLPQGVHRVAVESILADLTDWEWTFLLRPRRVAITAPGWNVSGVRSNGIPEQQVFFARQQRGTEGAAAYDRKDFDAVVAVDRHVETGLIWQVRNQVNRLSAPGKAISLRVPLLPGENVLTSNVEVEDGLIEVQLGAGQEQFTWMSDLPVAAEINMLAPQTEQWVERWYLVTSPVWHMAPSGLAPVFEAQQQNLIPVWYPWPGEAVTLSFQKPTAVSGDTVTVQHARHDTTLGRRQRTTQLKLDVECSLASDFVIEMDSAADISSLSVDGKSIPVRLDGSQLILPVHPGKQTVEVAWKTDQEMAAIVGTGLVKLPVEGSNINTVMRVPESRWVLWAAGPLRGPAVRFWAILMFAIPAAVALGSLSLSPLRRLEWVLLTIGLTQVHVVAALIVVAWLFMLSRRGKRDPAQARRWLFNISQVGLVLVTLTALGILIVIVGKGLLGNPEMFIVGNNSSRTFLQWFQPRVDQVLPEPYIVSISVWFYRLLMLFWALWLAAALLRWLTWGWRQFSNGGSWMRKPSIETA